MTKFAHIETGRVLNVNEDTSAEEYLKRFHPSVTTEWVVVVVDDSIIDNALVVSPGNYTNHVPYTPEIVEKAPEEAPSKSEILEKLTALATLVQAL